MISFTNLCSYRFSFLQKLNVKREAARLPFFLFTIISTGRRANSKVAQKRIFMVAVPLDILDFFYFCSTGKDALGRKNAGQKKGGFRLLVSK